MDYLVYVDNSNDRFSLLDMIEVDSQALDNDEKWHITHHCMDSADSTRTRPLTDESRSNNMPVIDDACWLDLTSGCRAAGRLRNDGSDGTACAVNRDPHLLVNPRTVAPVLDTDTGSIANVKPAVALDSVSDITVVPPTKIIKIEPATNDVNCVSAQPQYVSFATMQPAVGSTILTVAPTFAGKLNTVPVFFQVATPVGNIIRTDGQVCIVKLEPDDGPPEPVDQDLEPVTTTANATENENVDVIKSESTGCETFEKPVFSYSCLIAMALKNSETGSLPVNEIYAYILEKFPYFRSAPDGWKNSIRHNLSLNKCFEKIENPMVNGGSRKGCLWGLNPAKADKMDDEIAKWIKRAARANGSLKTDYSSTSAVQSKVFPDAIDDDAVSGNALTEAVSPSYTSVSSDRPPSDHASAADSEYFTMLEDSFTSDPMLACLAVQNGLWDDLTESDELKVTALSFGGSQIGSQNNARQRSDVDTSASLTVASNSGPSCRVYHSKAALAMASGRTSSVAPSNVIIVSQPVVS